MFSEKTCPFWTELEMPSSIFTDLILLFSTPLPLSSINTFFLLLGHNITEFNFPQNSMALYYNRWLSHYNILIFLKNSFSEGNLSLWCSLGNNNMQNIKSYYYRRAFLQLTFIAHTVIGNENTNISKTVSMPFTVFSLIGNYLYKSLFKYLFKCVCL